jgi:hypothetical protein
MTQYQRIGKLLTRRSGCTAMEITTVAGTVSCHSRLSEMKHQGWIIVRKPIDGQKYGRYFGVAPRTKA